MTLTRRSLTGAWIETYEDAENAARMYVAPLRGRGLKLLLAVTGGRPGQSLPYGGVD